MKRLMGKLLVGMLSVFMLFNSLTVYAEEVDTDENAKIYNCDYKILSLKTNVAISKDGEEVGNISGKIIRLITDPLTFANPDGDTIGFASDNYNFISQDDHAICIGDTIEMVMSGKFTLFGEKYDLLDVDGNKIGTADFDWLDTYGEIKDLDGNVCATYESGFFRYDYDVEIYNDTFSDEAILLITASYKSDKVADSTSGSSSNSSSNN